MTPSQSQFVCDIPANKLRNVAKELKGSLAANQQPQRPVIKNHSVRQPCAIVQNNIMQRPTLGAELLLQLR